MILNENVWIQLNLSIADMLYSRHPVITDTFSCNRPNHGETLIENLLYSGHNFLEPLEHFLWKLPFYSGHAEFFEQISDETTIDEYIDFDFEIVTSEAAINTQNVDWRQESRERTIAEVIHLEDVASSVNESGDEADPTRRMKDNIDGIRSPRKSWRSK